MSGLYTIPLSGLKEGQHTFDFEIGNEFFEEFEESEIKEGSLNAVVEMGKRSSHLDLLIRISGTVQICCDRCLEMFPWTLECSNRLLVKIGKSISDDDFKTLRGGTLEDGMLHARYLSRRGESLYFETISVSLRRQALKDESKK